MKNRIGHMLFLFEWIFSPATAVKQGKLHNVKGDDKIVLWYEWIKLREEKCKTTGRKYQQTFKSVHCDVSQSFMNF